MGAFIPFKIDGLSQDPDYSAELEQLTFELRGNPLLQLSQFCNEKGISYTGFKNYLVSNDISIKDLREKISRMNPIISVQSSDLLTNISIKLANQMEVMIPSISPVQLLNILKSL